MSIEDSVRLGAQSYVQILQNEAGNVLCVNARTCDTGQAEVVRTVREIGTRLEAAAIEYERELLDAGYSFTPVAEAFDWTYNVVESNQPNAFCLPGGYVAVYTGILDVTG
ncbi:MAG: M48 family metalloprotease, partial [Pseudomonadota bacterium]